MEGGQCCSLDLHCTLKNPQVKGLVHRLVLFQLVEAFKEAKPHGRALGHWKTPVHYFPLSSSCPPVHYCALLLSCIIASSQVQQATGSISCRW